MHQRDDRRRHRVPLREPDAASSAARARSTQHKMGSLQDLPHVDMMTPITKFAATRAEHRARRRHGVRWRRAKPSTARPGPSYLEIPRDVLDREVDVTKARRSAARPLSRVDQVARRPARHRAAGRHPGQFRAARDPLRTAGVDVRAATRRRSRCCAASTSPATSTAAAAALLPPGDPHHFDRTRGNAFAEADVIVIVGTPFDFRMGYGRRISNELTLVQIDMDYRTVGKNRDIDLGLVGDPGAILGRGAAGGHRPRQAGQAPGAPAVDEEAARRRRRRPPRS